MTLMTSTDPRETSKAMPRPIEVKSGDGSRAKNHQIKISIKNLNVFYGSFLALKDISLEIPKNQITAIIGPSGCGKSTLIRAINRMTDLVPGAKTEGQVWLDGQDVLSLNTDVVEVRRRIGMVFQRPNPFPKSIFDNVAWGAKINGYQGDMNNLVLDSLKKAALLDEVHDKLKESGLSLSGGQQQRLCIARAIAVQPEVILMDEPCSALDPIATLRIEELMRDLAKEYTIIIVTHNMQQAARVSDLTAFFSLSEDGKRAGTLMEFGETKTLFTRPAKKITEDYITGRFG